MTRLVVLFQYRHEARWFYNELPERLGKFNLTLSAEKTRIIRFSRFVVNTGERFDFLGFEYHWGQSLKGKSIVKLRTSREKLQQALRNFTVWCRQSCRDPLRILFRTLRSKLIGYYNYYGVRGNYDSLSHFFYFTMGTLFKWLNNRSHRRSYNWKGFHALLKDFAVPKPRIIERWDRQLFLSF